LSIAEYPKMNPCPRSHGKDSLLEFARALEGSAVDPGDHVAGMDSCARRRAARLRLLKNHAMGYGHAETGSYRLGHRADLRANPPTTYVSLRFADEAERCRNGNENE
jgi:hypothetical protein